jgi:hypothetical protein
LRRNRAGGSGPRRSNNGCGNGIKFAAERFQQTLGEQLANLSVTGGRPVRLWVADEHRYGLIPVVRKCWTLRGVRPTVPYRTKYE